MPPLHITRDPPRHTEIIPVRADQRDRVLRHALRPESLCRSGEFDGRALRAGPVKTILRPVPVNIAVTSRSPAKPAAVFSVLLQASSWPSWTKISSVQLEGGGDPAGRQRVGDVRIFRTGSVTSRERIVELVEDRKFVYDNVASPFKSYLGTVELSETPDGGTEIAWSATLEPKIPFTGAFWRWYLTRFLQEMANGLATYAADGATAG